MVTIPYVTLYALSEKRYRRVIKRHTTHRLALSVQIINSNATDVIDVTSNFDLQKTYSIAAEANCNSGATAEVIPIMNDRTLKI